MIDFHTHILPAMDDGAKSVEESLSLVESLHSQQVTEMVCSSHFYSHRYSMEEFLQRRRNSFDLLQKNLEPIYHGEIHLHPGAEVYFSDFLGVCSDLSPLCIGHTSLLLLEMPFQDKWSSDVWKIMEKIISRQSITPVIAHAERYPGLGRHPEATLKQMIDMGCVIQINCDSFLEKQESSRVLQWLDSGLVHLLGTDCHNMDYRPPHMAEACAVISSALGPDVLAKLELNSTRLISGKPLKSRGLMF